MSGLDLVDFTSLAASIMSLVLAVLAIWLSIVFYKLSTKASDSTNKASEEIHSSVTKLEQLFDRLYNDTFSVMRDTVSDMRRHIWPDQISQIASTEKEVQDKTEKRIDELKLQMTAELSSLLAKQKDFGGRAENLTKDLLPILNKAINESTKVTVETREDTIMEAVLTVVKGLAESRSYTVSADDMIGRIDKKYALSLNDTLGTLKALREEGIIHWEGPDYVLSSTRIDINPEILKKAPAPR